MTTSISLAVAILEKPVECPKCFMTGEEATGGWDDNSVGVCSLCNGDGVVSHEVADKYLADEE